MTAWVFAFGGVAAGAAQAGLLARVAESRPSPVSFFGRLLLVGFVLFVAARAGYLAPCAAGWMAGFASTGTWVHRRLR